MKNFDTLIKKYAELTVKKGVNIQEGQTLVILSPIECAEFTRQVTEFAYKSGAKNVHVEWADEKLDLIKYKNASLESLKEYPAFRALYMEDFVKNGAALISISAADPDIFKSVDPHILSEFAKARSIALKNYREYIVNSTIAWSVVSIPTVSWAKKVFPGVCQEEAIEKLWETIFKVVRVDEENPVEAWDKHIGNLETKVNALNNLKIKKLHYKSAQTDLTIEMSDKHMWCGGAERNAAKTVFLPNLPTEEVFTLPLKNGINGIVKSTKPLNYQGNTINNFSLTFKDGKIVDFTAEEGYDMLSKLIGTDEGSAYIGEVALVPVDSPISNSNITFYNTLFDENASCHLAFGNAYPICLQGGTEMDDAELEKNGANISLTHEDFMIGSSDLDIIAEDSNGLKTQIFRNGNWAI